VYHEGDWITINGTTGEVIKGQQGLKRPTLSGDLGKLMAWVDERRTLHVKVRARGDAAFTSVVLLFIQYYLYKSNHTCFHRRTHIIMLYNITRRKSSPENPPPQANADTPEDARVARENGAEGIGLCRTEHMFFSTHNRIR
jgi:pyruvate, orthophosphate dikinase